MNDHRLASYLRRHTHRVFGALAALALLGACTTAATASVGVRDAAFTTGTGTAANMRIETLAVQPDGKVIIGMYGFGTSTWNGAQVNYIARLNADGTLDTAFRDNTCTDPGDATTCAADASVRSVSLQADGKILVGGDFRHWYGASGRVVNGFVRLNADGTLDTSFLGANCTVGSLSPGACHGWNSSSGFSAWLTKALQAPDGKLVMIGYDSGNRSLTSWNGTPVPRLVRLASDGTIDATFLTNITDGPDPDPVNNGPGPFGAPARDAAFQADGKTVIVGFFTKWNNVTVNGIVRLNSNGTRDTSFQPTPSLLNGNTTAIQPDGKILVGGSFGNSLIRLNADGTEDTGFTANLGTGGNAPVFSVALQADGKILVGGNFSSWNGTRVNGLVRLNSNGAIDTDFLTNTCLDGSAYDSPCAALDLDPYYSSLGPGIVMSVGVAADGSALVGGGFSLWGGYPTCDTTPTAVTVNNIVRLDGPVAPCAPRTPGATGGAGEATVTWTAPLWDGAAIITGYEVTSTQGGYTCTTTGALTCNVTGLPAGAYTFEVRARNSAGLSPEVQTVAVTVEAAPAPPTPAPTPAPVPTPDPTASVTKTAAERGAALTTVTVTGPGTLRQVGTRTADGGRARTVCATRQTVTEAGTVVLTCRVNAATRLALREKSVRVRLVTTFTTAAGVTTTQVRTVVLKRLRIPPVTG